MRISDWSSYVCSSDLIGAGIACLAATVALPPRPRLVWNASASAPIGLYVVTPPDRIGVGDMVIAWPPDTARRLGAQRRYIPFNVPLVKRAAAAPRDTVCAPGPVLFVDARAVAPRLAVHAPRRPVPWWSD